MLAWTGVLAADHVVRPAYTDGRAGLPQNSVRTVLVDRANYVWVGTERGLARFDGHRFVNFSEQDERVPVDVLIALYEDRQGRIWTNWYKHNPRVLSADRGRVIEVRPRAGQPDDLHEAPYSLYEDPYGYTWFTGKRSVYWMDPDGRYEALELPGDNSLRAGGAGDFFYAAQYDVLYAVDVRERPPRLHRLDLPGQPKLQPGQVGRITRVETWRDEVIVCAPYRVYRVTDPATGAEPIYDAVGSGIANCRVLGDRLLISEQTTDRTATVLRALALDRGEVVAPPAGLPDTGFIASVYRDAEGGDWAVVDGRVHRRPAGHDAFEPIGLRARVFGLMDAIAQSRGGEFWIGTDGAGLARLAPHRTRFQTVAPPPVEGRTTSPQVRRIAVDGLGRVWMGTDERGIARWDRRDDSWRLYRPHGHEEIRQVAVTRDGSAWACDTEHHSLLRYDADSDRWRDVLRLPSRLCTLHALADGDLLIASVPDLLRLAPRTGETRRLNRTDLAAQARAIAVDTAGAIWLGIHDRGLLTVAPDGAVHRLTAADSGLASDQIFALAFDHAGMLWIGSWHGGLQRYDPRSGRFETWGTADGLPDDTVFGLQFDDRQALWLSTYRGLVRFEPCAEPGCRPGIHVFNRVDGLQGDEFDAEAHYRAADGELFFGGSDGFNAFHPGAIHLNDTPPRAAITQATVDGRPLPGADSPFEPPEQARLPHDFGELRIEVSSLDYNAPAKNRYQYRIGPEAEWRDMDGAELVLRGLPEGEHRLAFRGSNNDGAWSENPLQLALAVPPPPWRHPFMLALYAAGLLFVPLVYYGRRQARLVAARRELEAQVAERTRELEQASAARERFFANVSHEIAAPLHMILLMLEQRRDEAPDEEDDLYRSATGYAAQLLAYLRQLVDGARSFEADSRVYRADIVSLVNALIVMNRPVAGGRHIRLVAGRLAPGEVRTYRHSVSAILSNLLCNALIYAPEGGEVRISGRRKHERYRLTVSNTLHPDHPLDLEEAMQRGQRGAFDATAFGGHGLGLSIVTESVESLGGRIRLRVTDDGRVRFDVFLPLADPALPPLPEQPDVRLDHEQRLAIESIEPDARGSSRSGRGGRRVLVVEDDDNVSGVMADLLADEFRVTVARDADSGIRLARETLPEIVLCDLFLPDQSGFEVLRAVRGNRMTMNSLFIFVTASVSETDHQQGVRLGADHFLHKPVSAETIRGLIHNHDALAQQRESERRAEDLRQRARNASVSGDPEHFEREFDAALEELYPDPAITVEDLQLRLAMGYSALNRRCREHFGRTPKRLLLEKRIDKAQGLLRDSTHKVGLIAELSGFSSHAQFAAAFKRLTGLSPAEYRNRHKALPAD
jgi:signal transduction histidine kinase/DNA-binding response OmpR family regulator/streptogramin lyase